MLRLTIAVLAIATICFSSFSAHSQDVAEGAEQWFLDTYASVWDENAFDRRDEIAALLDETIYYHPSSGNVEELDGRSWMAEVLQGYKDADLQRSELVAYTFDQLNPSTATYKTKWVDYFANGSETVECWWYMADKSDDRWVITQFALLDCNEQSF